MGLAGCAAAFPRRYFNQVQIIPLQVYLAGNIYVFISLGMGSMAHNFQVTQCTVH
jgi:hypothetical protein